MSRKVGRSADPVPQRRSPHATAIDGIPAASRVTGRPGYRYLIVNRADREECAKRVHEGWRVVRWAFEKDENGSPKLDEHGNRIPENACFAVGLLGDEHEGDHVECMGNLLYETTEERWKEIQKYGADGAGGQEEADRVEDRIIRHRGFIDPMRGITSVQARTGSYRHGDMEEMRDLDWKESKT